MPSSHVSVLEMLRVTNSYATLTFSEYGNGVSRKALAKANSDSQLKKIVGENIEQGQWYEASMTVDHEGHSAACSFPISGSLCSANIHLRAVRYEGRLAVR